MSGTFHGRPTMLGCVGFLGLALAACSDVTPPLSPEEAALAHASHGVVAAGAGASATQLAELRRATDRFHRLGVAREMGWDLQFTPCIVSPAGAGGMGFHYVNPDLLDGTLNIARPEALLYEPDASGRLRLVAVEYLVPFTVRPPTATPPELFGLPFSPSPAFGVWGLHAWVWKSNPSGVHAPFNPLVSCDA